MSNGHFVALLRHLRGLAGARETAALSDRHLLERYYVAGSRSPASLSPAKGVHQIQLVLRLGAAVAGAIQEIAGIQVGILHEHVLM
jgi:hypothetical protein